MKLITLKPLNFSFYITFGKEDLAKFEKKFKFSTGIHPDSLHGAVVKMEDNNGNTSALMYLEDNFDYDTLYHEIIHLVHFMCESRGVPSDASNTEFIAYSCNQVAEEIRKKMPRA